MAKSGRSKVKRSFRAKKRDTGIYAATEAARLQRLSAKITALASKDKEGDVPLGDVEGEQLPGWCWFAAFGLLDPSDITLETMEGTVRSAARRRTAAWRHFGLLRDIYFDHVDEALEGDSR
jgi:Protein of unknown function (DUF2423)